MKTKLFSTITQTLLGVVFLYFLTGGAFLIPWESIPKWKTLSKVSTLVSLLCVSLTGLFLYWKKRELFFKFQPFRSIVVFFNLPPAISVTFLAGAFLITQLVQQVSMHYGLETHLWDMGFYDQVLWNTARGDFLITSVRGGIHVFAEHFKPIFVLIAQVYRFQDATWPLLAITTFFTASSLVAVYLIAKEITRSHHSALVFAIAVFFYRPLVSGVNFLYHTQMLIDPFLLWGFYCILKKKNLWGFFFFLLALTCKESAVPDLFGMGLFLFFTNRKKTGLGTIGLSLAWFLLFVLVIEPRYIYAAHFKEKWTFFRGLLHPSADYFRTVFNSNLLTYLLKILGPFLFLCLASLQGWLCLAPSFLFRALSSEPGFRSLTCHYQGGFEALIFITAIYGFYRWTHSAVAYPKSHFLSKVFVIVKDPAVVRVSILFVALLLAGRSQLVTIDRFLSNASRPDNQRVIRVLESIPSDYSVLASQNLATHLSHRAHFYAFCSMFPKTPYEERAKHPDIVAYDVRKEDPCGASMLEELQRNGYQNIYEVDYLKIFALPQNSVVDPESLKANWNVLVKKPVVPYWRFAKLEFLTLLFLGGVIMLMVSRSNKSSHESHNT